MRKRNKWIAAGVGLWLTGAVCIGSGVFLDNPSSALTRVVQAATQSETTQGQIDAANKKQEGQYFTVYYNVGQKDGHVDG